MLLYEHSPYKSGEDLTDLINIFKRKGKIQLREQTICHAPHYENMIADRSFDYYHDGQRVVTNLSNQLCFRLNYLYVKSIPNKTYVYLSNWMKLPMIEAIQNDYIKPFILFLNGRFIPWEIMNIVFTVEEYYLILETDDPIWNDMFKHPVTFSTIVLYDGIEYITGANLEITDQTLFSFNDQGLFTTYQPSYIINNIGTMVSVVNYRADGSFINGMKIMDNDDPLFRYRLQPDATIVFRNNLLDDKAKVRYDGTILTVNDGILEDDKDILYCKIFINKNSFKSTDNIFRANQAYIEQYIRDMNLHNIYPTYMDLLIKNFDLKFDKDLTEWEDSIYKQNYINAINTIMSYNMWLFNYVYKVNSNFDILEVNGQYVLDRVQEDGCFRIPRAHANGIQYCIMLVNGEIYKYSELCKYEFNFWAIPIHRINPDDIIELWFFKNIRNDIFETTITGLEGYKLVNEDYINDTMVLFSTTPKEEYFKYPKNGAQHFPVDYTLDFDGIDGHKIIVDPFYYNEPLIVAYKNRFIHQMYVIDEEFTESIKFDLERKFMYCNDYNKYMVFINGRRISTEHFRLVLPMSETTPFSEFYIYITLPLKQNDKIDIYYLPCLMKDILVIPELDKEGLIHIDKEDINYPLSRDTYMVWVNGKKIPKSQILDIDATTLRIIADIETTDTVYITKYIEDFDYLTPFFHNNTSLWTMIMKELSATEMTTLLGKTAEEIHNLEPSIYKNALPVLSIMWELIRDQYMSNRFVDYSKPFVYDYPSDTSVPDVGDRDSADNVLVQGYDSKRTDNVGEPDTDRPWP